MTYLALDIGGANIKAADGQGYAASQYFPLWQQPDELSQALRAIIAGAPAAEQFVVTMTGELADCYGTKAEGVRSILGALSTAVDGRRVQVYLTDGRLVSLDDAREEPLQAAAANWHALARFACRFVSGDTGLLIDVGSTTTDIVPIVGGKVAATGDTDPDRLACGELVYTGVERSPICSLVSSLPWHGKPCPIAAELFATTHDVYVTLGELPEEPTNTHSADGRPMTKEFAHDRLARMICADREMFTPEDASAAAEAVRRSQLAKMGVAAAGVIARLSAPPATVVISGRGESLARELLVRLGLPSGIVSLTDELGAEVSRAATAHALAVLAAEVSRS